MIPITTKKQREVEKLKIIEAMCYSWDRTPGEGQTPYRLFQLYLSLGKTRSYIKAANLCERNYTDICKFANQFNWHQRSQDYDTHNDREMRQRLDEEILYAKMRQMGIGIKLQELAERGIEMLNEDIESLSPSDVAKLSDTGVKIINLALGSATEIKEAKIDAKVEVKTEYISPELAAKIGKELAITNSENKDD